MTGLRIRTFLFARPDLIIALLVSGVTGIVVLLQRIVIFGVFDGPDENRFAQLMAFWAVISVLLGRIQHRSMAGAAEQPSSQCGLGRNRWPVEFICLTVGFLAGAAAWVTTPPRVSLVLSSLSYAAALVTLLGLIGRAYGRGSATWAQVAVLVTASLQLGAVGVLAWLMNFSLVQASSALSLAVVAGTSVLCFWQRNDPPIDWKRVLTPIRHLLLGSAALASAWAACQGDILALSLVNQQSRLSEFGSAIFLGKNGLYAVLPIIPVLAQQSLSGRLFASWKLLLMTCLGATLAAAAVILGLTVLGTLPDRLIGSNVEILVLIALTQAPCVVTLTISYGVAMRRKSSLAAILWPLVSLTASTVAIRQLSGHPAISLILVGLSQALLALFLALLPSQQNAELLGGRSSPPVRSETTSMS